MDFSLTEQQQQIRSHIVDFCRKEVNEGILERDRDQTFPHDLWLKCGQIGLQGLPVPEEYGGAGLDPVSTAIALEAFGYSCRDGGLTFAVCAHLLACVVPIWRSGSEAQKRQYLPRLCDGTLIAVNAMTEPDSGSDPFTMATRAEPEGDGFRINGTKIFASNGPVADLAVMYAVVPSGAGSAGIRGGITGFLIEKGTKGFQVGQTFEKMGLRTSKISELIFDNVWVPATAVLGDVGAAISCFRNRWIGNAPSW